MDQATAIKRRAQTFIQRGAFKDAKTEYEKLLGLEPVNPYAYILIGDLSVRMGAQAEAIRHYDRGVEAYESLGLHRNAIAVLKRLMRLDPGQIRNLRRLADIYAKEGLLAEAVVNYLDFAWRRIKDKDGATDAREVLDIVRKLGISNSETAARVADAYLEIGEPILGARVLLGLAADLKARGQVDRARLLRLRAENIAADEGLGVLASLELEESQGHEPRPTGQASSDGVNTHLPREVQAGETPAADAMAVMPGLRRDGDIFAPEAGSPPALAGMGDEAEAPGSSSPSAGLQASAPASQVPAPEPASEQVADLRLEDLVVENDSLSIEIDAHFKEALPRAQGSDPIPAEVKASKPPSAEAPGSDMLLALFSGENPIAPPFSGDRHSDVESGSKSMTGEASGSALASQLTDELANLVDRFRSGVGTQIGSGDHATHYDLGITYMEMGVFSEAISEFRIAIEGSGYRQRCLELLATCYSRIDRPDLAAAHWRAAIQEAGEGDGDSALRYELACALAASGQVHDAREELRRVLGRDPTFDAARVRLEALES